MSLRFTKMHGLGNDFMVIDAIRQPVSLSPKQLRTLADRHTGIGFDQCLLIEPSNEPGTDFFYRIYNADGSEVGQCGNGARCLARFVKHYHLSTKPVLTIATRTTQMRVWVNANDTATVDMGIPTLAPQRIPLATTQQASSYSIQQDTETYSLHAIGLGNPHAVMLVEDVSQAPVERIGPLLSRHAFFPEQCNIGFMQRLSEQHIALRVFERGAGETQACGSGAAAAAAVGRLFYQLKENITVTLTGGELQVHWPHPESPLLLTGAATFIFEGTLL